MTTTTTNPKVYVGTWAKYNSGNLAGAWIDLTTCNTYEDFLRKSAKTGKEYRYFLPDGEKIANEILNETK